MLKCIAYMMVTGHEQFSNPEFEPAPIKNFFANFINRYDIYPRQLDDGRYICVKQPLSSTKIIDHLHGKITLGAYALDEDSQAQWICLDADTNKQWNQLHKLASHLTQANIPAYRELSRRGGHVWLFTPKMAGFTARQFAKQLLVKHKIEGIEIYPKQDKLKTGPGSLVRLPFGIHRKSGQRYHFIELNSRPIAPSIREQIALLSNPKRVPLDFIEHFLTQIPTLSVRKRTPPPLQLPKVPSSHGEYLSERIKNAVSVKDFISRYVELDHRNIGHCPFHDDEHPSFGVHEAGNYWSCFAGCGGGSIIDFWSMMRAKQGRDDAFVPTITDLAQLLFGS